MKKAAGTIRLDLAQYREMEVFTQFASDLDDTTKTQLTYGQGLMQALRQNQYCPYKQHEQVILLVVVLNHLFINIEINKIENIKNELLNHFNENHFDIIEELVIKKVLTDELKEKIIRAAKEFLQGRCL